MATEDIYINLDSEDEYVKALPGRLQRFIESCKDGSAFDRELTDEEVADKIRLWIESAEKNIKKQKQRRRFREIISKVLVSPLSPRMDNSTGAREIRTAEVAV